MSCNHGGFALLLYRDYQREMRERMKENISLILKHVVKNIQNYFR
jgi:hypothetical protein